MKMTSPEARPETGSGRRPSWASGVLAFVFAGAAPVVIYGQGPGLDMPLLAADIANDWKLWPWGFALHTELASMVAEGATALTALQSATLNPVRMLRATDSLGTIAPGKLADVVLLDADPLADITNTTTVRAVVANGRYFDRAALDQLLVEVQTRARQGFVAWLDEGQRTTMTLGDAP